MARRGISTAQGAKRASRGVTGGARPFAARSAAVAHRVAARSAAGALAAAVAYQAAAAFAAGPRPDEAPAEPPAAAATMMATSLANAEPTPLAAFGVGGQAVIADRNGGLPFAGRGLGLRDFSGVVGMSSGSAYVLVAEGRASVDGVKARPGEALIIPAFGAPPAKAKFDAARFAAQWSDEMRAAETGVFKALEKVARRQARGKFFGLYRTSGANLGLAGTPDFEMARRSVIGADAVADIRFSDTPPSKLPAAVAERFAAALAAGDADAVAALLDPTPYGGADLRGASGDARAIMALRLLSSRNWSRLLADASVTPAGVDGSFVASGRGGAARIEVRPVSDFVFVTSVKAEG